MEASIITINWYISFFLSGNGDDSEHPFASENTRLILFTSIVKRFLLLPFPSYVTMIIASQPYQHNIFLESSSSLPSSYSYVFFHSFSDNLFSTSFSIVSPFLYFFSHGFFHHQGSLLTPVQRKICLSKVFSGEMFYWIDRIMNGFNRIMRCFIA